MNISLQNIEMNWFISLTPGHQLADGQVDDSLKLNIFFLRYL